MSMSAKLLFRCSEEGKERHRAHQTPWGPSSQSQQDAVQHSQVSKGQSRAVVQRGESVLALAGLGGC